METCSYTSNSLRGPRYNTILVLQVCEASSEARPCKCKNDGNVPITEDDLVDALAYKVRHGGAWSTCRYIYR
jgi:hypothetical protein